LRFIGLWLDQASAWRMIRKWWHRIESQAHLFINCRNSWTWSQRWACSQISSCRRAHKKHYNLCPECWCPWDRRRWWRGRLQWRCQCPRRAWHWFCLCSWCRFVCKLVWMIWKLHGKEVGKDIAIDIGGDEA